MEKIARLKQQLFSNLLVASIGLLSASQEKGEQRRLSLSIPPTVSDRPITPLEQLAHGYPINLSHPVARPQHACTLNTTYTGRRNPAIEKLKRTHQQFYNHHHQQAWEHRQAETIDSASQEFQSQALSSLSPDPATISHLEEVEDVPKLIKRGVGGARAAAASLATATIILPAMQKKLKEQGIRALEEEALLTGFNADPSLMRGAAQMAIYQTKEQQLLGIKRSGNPSPQRVRCLAQNCYYNSQLEQDPHYRPGSPSEGDRLLIPKRAAEIGYAMQAKANAHQKTHYFFAKLEHRAERHIKRTKAFREHQRDERIMATATRNSLSFDD